MPRRKHRLSQQDLRTLGATPGLMSRRIGPEGRTRLEQLTSEARTPGDLAPAMRPALHYRGEGTSYRALCLY
jgi:hypothetical protein